VSSDARRPQLQATREAVLAAATQLAACSLPRRARAIAGACAQLADSGSAAGSALRAALLQSSGLGAENIEWCLGSTLTIFEEQGLLSLAASRTADVARGDGHVALVLAGNVFSAAARPMLLALLAGRAVLAKVSSRDDALPRALAQALGEQEPAVGAAVGLMHFGRDDAQALPLLWRGARLLAVYGSDATVEALEASCPADLALRAHGHGFGVAAVGGEVLASPTAARDQAAALALDAAAYDQRGCLSPQLVLVEPGAAVSPERFAQLLAEALAELDATMPRGALPPQLAAQSVQFCGVAAARGRLWRGAGYAVSYEGRQSLRGSPGYRHLPVFDLAQPEGRLRQLEGRLKALASVGLDPEGLPAAPYHCAPGFMQRPPLAAPLDGLHPLAGF